MGFGGFGTFWSDLAKSVVSEKLNIWQQKSKVFTFWSDLTSPLFGAARTKNVRPPQVSLSTKLGNASENKVTPKKNNTPPKIKNSFFDGIRFKRRLSAFRIFCPIQNSLRSDEVMST